MVKICISGTPGSGKSEIAKELAKALGWKMVELNKLAKKSGCVCGHDAKRDCDEVDIEKLSKEVEKIKEDVILESHFAHCVPCDVVFMLRVNPRELRKRMEKRGWKSEKIQENVDAEITEVCKTEALDMGRKVYDIDTTNKKPKEVVEEILKVINPYLG